MYLCLYKERLREIHIYGRYPKYIYIRITLFSNMYLCLYKERLREIHIYGRYPKYIY
jgi:hypothetical protein